MNGQPTNGHATSDAPRASVAQIEQRLREGLQPEWLEVLDDSAQHAGHAGAREGGHYTVRVISERFRGLTRVAQHTYSMASSA